MIKDKGDKVGGNRNNIKEEIPENDANSSRVSGANKETEETPRVKMERGEDGTEMGGADIKTEMDSLMDNEGDPTKSPSCDMAGPGSLKSERLSSDSNDILDPQTGLRGTQMPMQDGCQRGGGPGPEGGQPPCRGPEGPQPLPSNVVSKQPSNMEYSQQQSQIFVFSTQLANKGAEAVLQGHFQSIIAYHCAQPGTKKYLEKHPLKMGQFNKQNPAQWLNNLAMVKNRGAIRGSGGPGGPPGMMGPGPNHPSQMMGQMGPGMGQMGPGMGQMGPGMGQMGPGMGQMGPGMGQMGPGMGQMGPGRMGGGGPHGPGGQMMMMKGGGGQMGQMGQMGPMDGYPGNNGPCGVMDGMGSDGDMPWDNKNPMHPNGPGSAGPPQDGPGQGQGGGGPQDPRGGGSPADLLKLPNLQGAYHGTPLIRFLTHPSLLNAHHSSDSRVKIPDENLTPQQRAHREEQLATIRKMQQMLFPESGMGPGGPQGPNQGQMMCDPSQNPNEQNQMGNNPNMPPNSNSGPNMGFNPNQMGPMGQNCPGNMGPMGPMGPNGPNCSMGPNGPMGHNGPMGPNMGQNGPMGPNMGGNGPMSGMGPNGPMGPMSGMMGPNGPMGSGMQMGPMGPCMKGGMRGSQCGGPDMKPSMCGDMHMSRPCSGPMGRMGNPMGGMKPCMMGPRMMPGANINAMNGGIMMDGGSMGDCGGPGGPQDHHMGMGPMCDDFPRGRNMSGGPEGPHKLGLRSPGSAGPDLDWQKLHHQFFEQEHNKNNMDPDHMGGQVKSPCSERGGVSSGGCLPPPPYGASPLHRSASVPIATQSPSQCSNIQMPMSAEASRAGSALSSPAECPGGPGRGSGPGGAQSGPPPSSAQQQQQHKGLPKNPLEGGPEEGMFVRTLQCLAAQQQKNQQQQQQQQSGVVGGGNIIGGGPGVASGKEANLMPVPSPQKIQYLNTFEGQELTIQKQPNTSLKDGPPSNQKSPGMMPGTPEAHNNSGGGQHMDRAGRYSLDHSPGFPGSNNPQTPNSNIPGEKQRPSPSSNRSQDNMKTPSRDQIQGPTTPGQSSLNQGPYAPNQSQQQQQSSQNQTPASTAATSSANSQASNQQSMSSPGHHSMQGMGKGMGACGANMGSMGPKGAMDDSPTGMQSGNIPGGGPEGGGMGRGEHAPLAPSGGGAGGFDPISSLAQMSQQLTGGPPHPHPHHHPALLMQDMGCHMGGMGAVGPMDGMMGPGDFPPDMNMSPKMGDASMGPMGLGPPDPSMMGGPRMPGKMAAFNGANVQVKASAPNTIQYLPTRPQLPCSAGPRGPPSLDFLQRVANPMHMEAKNNMNMQYFPGGPCGGPMGHNNSPGMGPRMDMSDQMMGPMRPQGPMMGPMRGGPGMIRMPHYPGGFNSPPKMADPFSGGMPPGGGMMCNPGFRPSMMKGGPMRMGAPNTSQPLPASMGGPGAGFKSSQGFVMPSTADPNYAQQFHNFQQQLYATGTRSQAQPGPHYPGYMPK